MSRDPHALAALNRLRSVLESAAREAGDTQSVLQNSTGQFLAVSQNVVEVVGGSAQRVDQHMVGSLQEATRSTSTALSALAAAVAASRSVR